jgi:hypothetical protein
MGLGIRPVVIAVTSLAFAITASETRGDEFYDAMIFGSQSQPKLLQYTHTWATFIRAVGEGPDPNNYTIYQHTISWLPQPLDVRIWSLRGSKHEGGLSDGASFYISCNISFNERRHSVNVPGATGTTRQKGRTGVSSRLKLKAMESRNRPGDRMASPDWYGQGWIA